MRSPNFSLAHILLFRSLLLSASRQNKLAHVFARARATSRRNRLRHLMACVLERIATFYSPWPLSPSGPAILPRENAKRSKGGLLQRRLREKNKSKREKKKIQLAASYGPYGYVTLSKLSTKRSRIITSTRSPITFSYTCFTSLLIDGRISVEFPPISTATRCLNYFNFTLISKDDNIFTISLFHSLRTNPQTIDENRKGKSIERSCDM